MRLDYLQRGSRSLWGEQHNLHIKPEIAINNKGHFYNIFIKVLMNK